MSRLVPRRWPGASLLTVAVACLICFSLAPTVARAKKCFNVAHILEDRMSYPRLQRPDLRSMRVLQRLDQYANLRSDRCARAVTGLATRLLADDDEEIRASAADALRLIGQPAMSAVPALWDAQKRSSCKCRDGNCDWADGGAGVSIAWAIMTITGDLDDPYIFNCRPPDARANAP